MAVLADHDLRYVAEYESSMALRNETTRLHFPEKGHTVEGVILGITPEGALRLGTQNGEQVYHAGEVTTLRREQPSL